MDRLLVFSWMGGRKIGFNRELARYAGCGIQFSYAFLHDARGNANFNPGIFEFDSM